VLAVEDLVEPADRVLEPDVLAGGAGEDLGHVERLAQELLDLARPRHRHLVLVGQLVHAEDGDDALEVLVALEHLLDARGGAVVVVADRARLEDA